MEIPMKIITCPQCFVTFAITENMAQRLGECHNTFYCPSGHGQWYPQKTESEMLKTNIKEKEIEIETLTKKLAKCKRTAKQTRPRDKK